MEFQDDTGSGLYFNTVEYLGEGIHIQGDSKSWMLKDKWIYFLRQRGEERTF